MTSDITYLSQFEVILKSILSQHKSDIAFHLIYGDPDSNYNYGNIPDIIKSIQTELKQFENVSLTVYPTQNTNKLKSIEFGKSHLNANVFLRFEIPSLPLTGRVLYIDLDLLILNDISYLFECDLQGARFGMVTDMQWRGVPWTNPMLNYLYPYQYCNAGVMIMDLDKIHYHGDDWYKSFLEYELDAFPLYDQDFFNHHFKDDKLILAEEYNFNCLSEQLVTAEKKVRKDSKSFVVPSSSAKLTHNLPAIIHWNGGKKPWHQDQKLASCKNIWNLFEQMSFTQARTISTQELNRKLLKLFEQSDIYSIPYFTTNHLNYLAALHALNINGVLFGFIVSYDKKLEKCSWSYKIGEKEIAYDCTNEMKQIKAILAGEKDISELPPMIYSELRRFKKNRRLNRNIK